MDKLITDATAHLRDAALAISPKLALGTVQFGMPYGLAHLSHAVPRCEVRAVLACAWKNGIDMLDTAAAYGNAEVLIGTERPPESHFAIVTKASPVRATSIGPEDRKRVAEAVHRSAERLRVAQVDALLFHQADDLLVPGGRELYEEIDELRRAGLIGRLGASVYDPTTLERLLERFPLSIAQIPLNVFDQRFIRSGVLRRAAALGVELHARSAFLQGALLSWPGQLPARFHAFADHLREYQRAIRNAGLSPAAAAFHYLIKASRVDRIVIGVDNLQNLQDDIAAFTEAETYSEDFDFVRFSVDDPDLIDPRRWT